MVPCLPIGRPPCLFSAFSIILHEAVRFNICDKREQLIKTTCASGSKAISEKGAHNQRGIVTVKVENKSFFWIEDIITLVENAASSAVYSILKREDEKFVTEHAYDNPRFVEDIVREVYIGLCNFATGEDAQSEKPFSWFSVEAESFESIHNHNAFAYTEFSE